MGKPKKSRQRQQSVETVCNVCGFTWWKGIPQESAAHRREHRRRMACLEPQPLRKIIAARKSQETELGHFSFNNALVTTCSPVWKHKQMYERAKAFKREFDYDVIQWDTPRECDPNAHGFLFTDDAGSIVGACAFRNRVDENKNQWGLQWVWICPKERRKGHLSKRWKMFRKWFGGFRVEPPVSKAMEAFLIKQEDES